MSRTLSKKRARVLVVSQNGSILLVKTWFGRQRWALPGGGVAQSETLEQAAMRELREETAIQADISELSPLGTLRGRDGLPFHLVFFTLRVDDMTLKQLKWPYKYEIIGREWVMPNALPAHTSPTVYWALKRAKLL